jgi:argininosuccinate synthase
MKNTTNNKVVLAFSGGLDTSYCALYLAKEKKLEVHAVTVNTGGFTDEEITKMEQHALTLGVTSFHCIDETENFYRKVIRYLVFGNVLKNNTYPLSVSAERVSQAVAISEYTRIVGAAYVAHGSTGAGNDQVRFDLIFNTLIPDVKILTPIRDLRLSREEEINFLKSHGVNMNFEKAKYSINKGIWGTSVGGKETLSSHLPLPEEAYPTPVSKHTPVDVVLDFKKGQLSGIDGKELTPVQAIKKLNELASGYGIGRDVHVGDTIIGIKGRVGFEAAAPLIIIKAHHLLEKHTLSKQQLFLKDQLSSFYGSWLHEGLYSEPAMRNLEIFLESTQEKVSGKVFVTLRPYRFTLNGVETPHDLMSDAFGSYGEANKTWSGEDVKGFTKIFGNQVVMYNKIHETDHA